MKNVFCSLRYQDESFQKPYYRLVHRITFFSERPMPKNTSHKISSLQKWARAIFFQLHRSKCWQHASVRPPIKTDEQVKFLSRMAFSKGPLDEHPMRVVPRLIIAPPIEMEEEETKEEMVNKHDDSLHSMRQLDSPDFENRREEEEEQVKTRCISFQF